MSFIDTTRIYSKKVSISDWRPYLFDLLFLGAIWLAVGSYRSLEEFRTGKALIVGSPYDVSILGGLGIGGIRLSMYIAIIRENRAPQRLEWITCLGGIAFMFVFVLFGGSMLNAWADAHDYRRCSTEQARKSDAVFARVGTACPANWQGQPLDQ